MAIPTVAGEMPGITGTVPVTLLTGRGAWRQLTGLIQCVYLEPIRIFSDMAKQMNWLQVDRAARQRGLTLFSPQDLRHLLGASEMSVRFLLTRANKRGDVIKLRRELYTLPDQPASDLEIANRLYRPSYVSFEYALAYHHLIPESVYEITSATSRTS